MGLVACQRASNRDRKKKKTINYDSDDNDRSVTSIEGSTLNSEGENMN